MSHERFSDMLYARGIQGIILAPVNVGAGHLRLRWERFAAVKIGYSLAFPPLHYAANHQFHSMRLACHELRRLGYRRLGLAISRQSDTRSLHQWVAAFIFEQQKAAGNDRVPPLLAARGLRPALLKTWLDRHRPDALIGTGMDLLEWMQAAGLSVPGEVAYANLDLPDASGSCAGVFQHPQQIGAQAVELLQIVLQCNELGIPAGPRGLISYGSWVASSTAPRRIYPRPIEGWECLAGHAPILLSLPPLATALAEAL